MSAPIPSLPERPRVRFGDETLEHQLVVRVTLLVAIVALTLSALTTLAVHTALQQQLDQQLRGRVVLVPPDGGPGAEAGPGGPGLQQGFLVHFSGVGWVQQGRQRIALTEQQNQALSTANIGTSPSTIRIPELGTYRIAATPSGVVVGLPTESVDKVMAGVVGVAVLLTGLAILVSVVAARRVVRTSLQPLSRLTAAAHHVSQLPLDSGDVAVPVRMSGSDANPHTEVGQVVFAFNHMLDNVEGALAARQQSETKLRRFVADASHELRNPLASIRGYAELTRRQRGDLPEETRHALARIESESERMSGLVQDLLLLAQLDSDPTLSLQPVDLTEVVANAVSDAQVAGPGHIWTVHLPPEDAEAEVLGDPHRLHQVIANLLSNARTHTPEGTEVTTSVDVRDGFAIVEVADNGPGIPPALLDRVFERFTRGDASRSRSQAGTPSTGLGLAIVTAVADAHGGTVTVDSEEGQGTTFELRIPLAP